MLSAAAPDRMGYKLSKSCSITQNPLLTNTLGKVRDLMDPSAYIRYKHNGPSAPFGFSLLEYVAMRVTTQQTAPASDKAEVS